MAMTDTPSSMPTLPALPLLYSFRRCPYAMRARMALAISAAPYTLCEVSLRNKLPALLAASPKGTVPVLVLPGGEVIDESLDIMRWALNLHDPEGWLGGDGDGDGQGMQDLIAQCDGPFKRQLDAYKYPPRQPADSRVQRQTNAGTNPKFADSQTLARQQASPFIDALNQRLTQSECLWGAKRTMADIAIVPFVRQFAGVQPAWFAQTPWSAVRGWLDRLTQSALFFGIMQR